MRRETLRWAWGACVPAVDCLSTYEITLYLCRVDHCPMLLSRLMQDVGEVFHHDTESKISSTLARSVLVIFWKVPSRRLPAGAKRNT